MTYDEPDLNRAALLSIDVQRDTLDGQPFAIPGTDAAVPVIARLAGFFRAAGRPIVHVVRLYRQDGSNAELCRRSGLEAGWQLLVEGSPGSEIAPGILPTPELHLDAKNLLKGQPQPVGPREWILYKPRWGAFFGTSLESMLRDFEISTIVLTGCNFPNCPRTTLYEASERDFRLIAIKDAISGIYERGVAELRGIGVRVMTAESFLARAGAPVA